METPQDAAAKQNEYAGLYARKGGGNGWHFLVGSQPSIQAITQAIGFHYRWDAASKMFIHASGIMILTPEGRIARYLYGVEFAPKDLKLGLIEASHERIGSSVDRVLLFCYHYDPKTGKYTTTVLNILRISAILVLAALIVCGVMTCGDTAVTIWLRGYDHQLASMAGFGILRFRRSK